LLASKPSGLRNFTSAWRSSTLPPLAEGAERGEYCAPGSVQAGKKRSPCRGQLRLDVTAKADRPGGDNRAMPIRIHPLILALATAGFSAPALAAGAPPVAVQERVLVMPKLPADADVPVNLPEDGAVKMPFVTGGAPGVAGRINAAVWNEMLDGADAPAAPGRTFTPKPDKLPQGTSSLQYKAAFIPATNPRLLSLDFSGEGCGAYCEEFAITRVFDLRDGRELALGDLLTVDGFAAVGHRVDAERRRAYQKQVREIRAALKSAPKSGKKDDDDEDEERLMLNEDCLKQVASQPSTPQWLVNDIFSLDGHGGLALSLGRCSNHAMRALDDVGEITVAIPAADLKVALTPYGLAVVRQEGDAPPPAAFAGRELHGRLAGMPITMKLEPLRDGVETKGWYAYDKFHMPIALSLRKEGGAQVHAVEQAESRGEFDLTAAGGSLVGTWQDKEHRKRLPVILQ
jgi:hypothetical protein